MKVGIIGLDTPHAVEFTKILNDPKATGDLADLIVVAGYCSGKLKGARLIYVWFRLLDHPQVGDQMIHSILRWVAHLRS